MEPTDFWGSKIEMLAGSTWLDQVNEMLATRDGIAEIRRLIVAMDFADLIFALTGAAAYAHYRQECAEGWGRDAFAVFALREQALATLDAAAEHGHAVFAIASTTAATPSTRAEIIDSECRITMSLPGGDLPVGVIEGSIFANAGPPYIPQPPV